MPTLPTVEVTVLDKEYRVTPGFRVIEAWEERINAMDYNQRLMDGKPLYRDTAWIIWCALRYGTEATRDSEVPTYEEVGQWCMYEQGESIVTASRIFAAGVNPGREESTTRKKKPQKQQESPSKDSESGSTTE